MPESSRVAAIDLSAPCPTSSLQRVFPAHRDGAAWLHEPTHTYVVRGQPIRNSVTGLIKKFWPQFEPQKTLDKFFVQWKQNKSSKYSSLIDYLQIVEGRDDDACKLAIRTLWEKKGLEASQAGTAMHLDFQRICEGRDPPQGETREVRMFRNWLQTFCATYNFAPWRAEWVIFYEVEGRVVVAGQVDLVLKHTQFEKYACIDFKRSDPAPKYAGGPRRILGTEQGSAFADEKGSGPFASLPHNDFAVYTTQLNAYGYIAAKQYGVDFRDHMYLLQIHPSLLQPNLVRVERLDEEVQQMFDLETAASCGEEVCEA